MASPPCRLSSTQVLGREAIYDEKGAIMRVGIQLVFQNHKDYSDREMPRLVSGL
jgi:hypothetical protein